MATDPSIGQGPSSCLISYLRARVALGRRSVTMLTNMRTFRTKQNSQRITGMTDVELMCSNSRVVADSNTAKCFFKYKDGVSMMNFRSFRTALSRLHDDCMSVVCCNRLIVNLVKCSRTVSAQSVVVSLRASRYVRLMLYAIF